MSHLEIDYVINLLHILVCLTPSKDNFFNEAVKALIISQGKVTLQKDLISCELTN
jgi:hypothetical protein